MHLGCRSFVEDALKMNRSIPSPGDKQCFNCGKDLQNSAAFCPHCGAALPTQGSCLLLVLRFFGVLGLCCMAVFFGAAGACFMLVSSGPNDWFRPSHQLFLALTGLTSVVIAGLCIWAAVFLTKRGK
jgi:hypothetical protein